MICPACNTENDNTKKFCTNCGAKLPKVHYCVKCGSVLNENQKFCTKCGNPNPHFVQNNDLRSNQQPIGGISQERPNKGNLQTEPSYPVFSQSTAQQTAQLNKVEQSQRAAVVNTVAAQNEPSFNPETDQNITITPPIPSKQEIPELDIVDIPQVSDSGFTVQVSSNIEIPSQPNDEVDSSLSQTVSDVATITDKDKEENDTSDENQFEDENQPGSSKGWIIALILVLIVGGGILVLGQRINWWNMPFLSWVGGQNHTDSETSNLEAVALSELSENEAQKVKDQALAAELASESHGAAVEAADDGEVVVMDDVVGSSYTVNLNGKIGGKYQVEMILEGTRDSEGFYPSSGKYRYTKNNGAWINLDLQTEGVINSITHMKINEYTDGNLTGTWNVSYDLSVDALSGTMTNYKNDTYAVELSRLSIAPTSELKEGYNKITGAVVTSSKNYPFYIDFTYENGSITNAVYHNPDYNTSYNLSNGRISNGEFYFDGDHNGTPMTIQFSTTSPFKGTMTVGSNVRKIEMDL